ncbi:MAG: Initiation-control protein YabA [Pelotomaculum sp. PtaU1.Bin035]|nr:MAG: Initiation-control protein YabA [Pelotomaculum sp. PtaU1.Bin035]
MQSFYKLTKDMEVKLHALLAEMQELKNKARELEEENTRLRQELANAYREKGIIGAGSEETGGMDTGFLNLLGLYNQGFHICNLHFGRRLMEDCLFCMAFFRKGNEPAVGRIKSEI